MNISDWIQIIIGIITGIGVLSSIIISIKTLNQNNKMIEDSTRPNIVIYKDVYHINNPIEYLVIKNLGCSGAKIDNIIFDENNFKSIFYSAKEYRNPFNYLLNSYIAPNQCFKIPIVTRNNKDLKIISFEIKYSNCLKTYNEIFEIHLAQDYGINRLKFHNSSNELQVISNSIQEIVNRLS